MQLFKTVAYLLAVSICVQHINAQAVHTNASLIDKQIFNNMQIIKTDSGLIINQYNKGTCKNNSVTTWFIPNGIPVVVGVVLAEPHRPKLITIHGNISYDFFYRSKIDTPFNQLNLQQHTERVWLDVLIKEKYPIRVGFTARQSNSPFFRDFININLNFDRYAFDKIRKEDMLNRFHLDKWQNADLKITDSMLKYMLDDYQALKNWVNGPEALQRIIEEREKRLYSRPGNEETSKRIQLPTTPLYRGMRSNPMQLAPLQIDSLSTEKRESLSFGGDSSRISKHAFPDRDAVIIPEGENRSISNDSSFINYFNHKKEELNKLEKSIATLKHRSDSIKKSITQTITKVRKSVYEAKDAKELDRIAKTNGIDEPKKENLQRFLSGIKTLSIGRGTLDYTELTVQNIMLTGVNIEYNPSYYAAFAAGKIDYGFRDLFGRGIKQKDQRLILGRMGWGDVEKRAIILTVFNGRKNNYAGLLQTDSNNNSGSLFGYSVEAIVKKDEYTSFTVELAKSTKTSDLALQSPAAKPDNLFKFSDRTNMGFNLKGQTAIPATDTRLSGFYRKTGESFQSFSLFTYNTDQQAWQVRADQSILKRKLTLTAMLRQNDFTSPLTDKTFKTSTVFKSFQVNVRVPRWPIVNAGYYPGSQFYIIDNNTVRENVYYILNGSVLQAYTVKGLSMNSSFIYNRYFNHATDSGFVFYKGTNYILSQSLLIKKLQLDASYSYNKQALLNYYTLNVHGDYSLTQVLRLGGGIKYNHVWRDQSYWGETIRLSANLKKLGGLQLHYEKSYLPTIRQTLYPVEIGRVSWYKIF